MNGPTALIADDEPLLREHLARQLAAAWPELRVVAQAPNGREAVRLFELHRPDICFLDVHMPGLSGIDAARAIGRGAHLVFVTAYDQYALRAFDEGAVDYLVKPVQPARLRDTVERLRARMGQAIPDPLAMLQALAARLAQPAAAEPPRWLRVSIGQAVHLVAPDTIDFLRSEDKYTLVAWREADGKCCEALVRGALRELLDQLDPASFVQVHRSAAVNLASVQRVVRGDNETADLYLKGRPEVLKVSRTFLHLFKQM
jgi:DNA-binding LytR/AlgR family response regulator